jgi:hypothetical protein
MITVDMTVDTDRNHHQGVHDQAHNQALRNNQEEEEEIEIRKK